MSPRMGLPHSSRPSSEQSQEIREARRLLKERVREDWYYDPLPAHQKANSGRRARVPSSRLTVAGFHIHDSVDNATDGKALHELNVRLTGWRERIYSTDTDSDQDTSTADPKFRFEGPDTVEDDLDRRRRIRKRRKQHALVDEMQWNDGLAHWVQRRDLWSGARPSAAKTSLTFSLPNEQNAETISQRLSEPSDVQSEGSTESASTSSTPRRTSDVTVDAATTSSADTSPLEPDTSKAGLDTSSLAENLDIVLPTTTCILPNHPIRKAIGPSMYSEIYSKIITQGRTPSVPINLRSLIDALVKGWKDDGEWPPKPGIIEPSMVKKKKKSSHGSEGTLRSSVKAVGRVLRLTGIGESSSHK